jgi:hypothetical protein
MYLQKRAGTNMTSSGSTGKLSSGAIGGIVGGILGALLLITVAIIFYLLGRTRNVRTATPTTSANTEEFSVKKPDELPSVPQEIAQSELSGDREFGGRLRYQNESTTEGGRLGTVF